MTGSGFYAGERVRVTLDDTTLLGKARTTARGTFTLHATIPAGATAGRHTLQASGQTSFAPPSPR